VGNKADIEADSRGDEADHGVTSRTPTTSETHVEQVGFRSLRYGWAVPAQGKTLRRRKVQPTRRDWVKSDRAQAPSLRMFEDGGGRRMVRVGRRNTAVAAAGPGRECSTTTNNRGKAHAAVTRRPTQTRREIALASCPRPEPGKTD